MPRERSAKSAIVVPTVVVAIMVIQYKNGWNFFALICTKTATRKIAAKIAVPARYARYFDCVSNRAHRLRATTWLPHHRRFRQGGAEDFDDPEDERDLRNLAKLAFACGLGRGVADGIESSERIKKYES